jgi:hypothetical protein
VGKQIDVPTFDFDQIVSIKLGADWIAIDSAEEARACLLELWPERNGASYHRALANCEAFLAGDGPMEAARASLMVAAMEAGLPFELHENGLAFIDSEIATIAEENVRGDWDDFDADE